MVPRPTGRVAEAHAVALPAERLGGPGGAAVRGRLPSRGPQIDLHYEDYVRGAKPVLPLAAKAVFDSGRMFAQQAVVTVHGSDTRPLEEILSSDVLRKIDLTADMQEQTKEFFNFSNINAATVKPRAGPRRFPARPPK